MRYKIAKDQKRYVKRTLEKRPSFHQQRQWHVLHFQNEFSSIIKLNGRVHQHALHTILLNKQIFCDSCMFMIIILQVHSHVCVCIAHIHMNGFMDR